MNMLRSALKTVESRFGIRISRPHNFLCDLPPEIRTIVEWAGPYTMTSPERLASLCLAVEYAIANNVPGDFVECGVWKGGSSMAAAWTYRRLQREDMNLFLFDTFAGMSQPGEQDIDSRSGRAAQQLLANSNRNDEVWAYSPIAEVSQNLERTGYPMSNIHFVQGMVEDTIPNQAPNEIAILRLDTDWYESTRHELHHLFPRLSKSGILIIDDYGAWAGARIAVDEYFASAGIKPFLSRIDDTGRIYVKP
jgi:O-methyltransferase